MKTECRHVSEKWTTTTMLILSLKHRYSLTHSVNKCNTTHKVLKNKLHKYLNDIKETLDKIQYAFMKKFKKY